MTIPHFNQYVAENALAPRTFLMIGKGPSYAALDGRDTSDYVTVGLNHVVAYRKVDFAHVIDFEVALANQEYILKNARCLVMPWYPHFDCKPSRLSLKSLTKRHKFLEELASQGRLLWYNLGTTKRRRPGYPVVTSPVFSGDSVVALLCLAGITRIRTIGVDGGTDYGARFEHLSESTLLANGQQSFDLQFRNIRSHIMTHDIDFARFDESYPIRIFAGTTPAQMLATKVLEFSIRRHTKYAVEFHALDQSGRSYKEPADLENRQRTPFSFQRFLIPELAGYAGKAIYLDSDMQVFDDINQVWTLPMGDHDLLTTRRPRNQGRRLHFSVMLLDCAKLRWNIDEIINELDSGQLTYDLLMHSMVVATNIAPSISEHWNSLERFVDGHTKLIHYTDMDTQPWLSQRNPLGHIWVRELLTAIDSRAISIDEIQEHVDHGWVRPSLLYQVKHGIAEVHALPKSVRRADQDFVPPYEQLICGRTPVSPNRLARIVFAFRRNLQKVSFTLQDLSHRS